MYFKWEIFRVFRFIGEKEFLKGESFMDRISFPPAIENIVFESWNISHGFDEKSIVVNMHACTLPLTLRFSALSKSKPQYFLRQDLLDNLLTRPLCDLLFWAQGVMGLHFLTSGRFGHHWISLGLPGGSQALFLPHLLFFCQLLLLVHYSSMTSLEKGHQCKSSSAWPKPESGQIRESCHSLLP